jgi:hypothetical protein
MLINQVGRRDHGDVRGDVAELRAGADVFGVPAALPPPLAHHCLRRYHRGTVAVVVIVMMMMVIMVMMIESHHHYFGDRGDACELRHNTK